MNGTDDRRFSERLEKALEDAASRLAPRPDWEDLTRRRVRHERRKRNVAVSLLVGVVLAASAGAYALGDARDGESVVAAGDGRAESSSDGLADVETTPPPVLPRSQATGGVTHGYGETSGVNLSVHSATPLGRAFVRTTADGVTLRVYRGTLPPPTSEVPWFDPPPWCFPSGTVYVGASTDVAVGTAEGSTYDELRDGQIGATAAVIGIVEGAPARIVVAQAPSGTERVEARFPDGTTDAMAPIDGIAALATLASEEVDDPSLHDAAIEVRALDSRGSTLSSAEIRASSPRTTSEYFEPRDEECRADRLPPPGDEQPADVDAARAAVVDVFRRIHDGTASPEDRAALLDDPRGFVEITREIADQYGEPARTAQLGDIQLVFTSPTRAAVRFTVVATTGTFPFFGEAVLTDDGWKMTRDTWCREIRLAGKTCP